MTKRMQRAVGGFLAAVMIVLMFPSLTLTASATQSRTDGFLKDYTLTGDGATDMVNIALAQVGRTGSQIGYTEQWCGNFVSDCAILAGQTAAVPQNGLASGLYSAVMKAGGKLTTSSPKPGDLVFINWNGGTSISHVEIVYKVSGSSLYTVGGNSGSTGSLYTRYVKLHDPLGASYVLYVVRPAYTSQVTDYLNNCTYYAGYATVTAGSNASLWSVPCTDAVSSESVLIAKPAAGTVYTALGLYQNTKGQYWYLVNHNGTSCYLYGGDTSKVTPLYSDLSLSDHTPPETVICGDSFPITGTVQTEYSMITNVTGKIFTDSAVICTGSADVNSKYVALRSSAVNKGLKFGSLDVGRYNYELQATVTNCHTTDGLSLTYTSNTQTLSLDAFNVIPAADTDAPVISEVAVESVTAGGYRILATVTDNQELAQVDFNTWTESGGQDDLVTVSGTRDGSVFTTYVETADHGGASGTYVTEIAASDAAGNAATYQLTVDVPEPEPEPEPEGVSWSLEGSTLTISGKGDMDDYTYKSQMPWYSSLSAVKSIVIEDGVTSIGDYAFYGMPNLQTISIPASVTKIGSYAFKNCTALDGVELPAGLSKLGESAFYACSSLSAIDIPAELWSIQPYTFKNCTSLQTVTFHEGNLMKIWDGAFYNTGLTGVELPDCLDILDSFVFKNCSDMAYAILGDGITEIREAAFYGTALPALELTDCITKIGPYAFKNCTELDTVYMTENLQSIGEAAFFGCTGLSWMDFPEGLTSIGGYAFKRCSTLMDVSLPGTLTTLGDSAFHTCTALTDMTIPAGVKTVGEYCFSGSWNMWELTFQGNAPAIGTGAFNDLEIIAYYPAGNATWTADVMRSYGGIVTWTAK